MKKTFGQKIKERRLELKMTLEDLGSKISSTKAYAWELENKKTARPSAEKLLKLADALEVSPDYLINEDMNEQDDNATDDAFFRKFRKLSNEEKNMLKLIATNMAPDKDDKK